jgi:hypothetical protein
LCPPCRADPANVGWREAAQREVAYEWIPQTADPTPWGEGEDTQVPERVKLIAQLLLEDRQASLREIARRARCSEAYVRKITKWLEGMRKDK